MRNLSFETGTYESSNYGRTWTKRNTEQVSQQKEPEYEPWTPEYVESLLFFKDKIFRFKQSTFPIEQYKVCQYTEGKSSINYVGTIQFASRLGRYSLDQLFKMLEYSTDGINWLPCGKLKQ